MGPHERLAHLQSEAIARIPQMSNSALYRKVMGLRQSGRPMGSYQQALIAEAERRRLGLPKQEE